MNLQQSIWMGSALLLMSLVFSMTACTSDQQPELEQVDLMKHGLPIKVNAPSDIEVRSSTTMGQGDFILDGGEDYFVQIFVGDASSGGKESLLNELKGTITSNRFFHEFVVEEEDGFVYEFQLDSLNSNFGFRRVWMQGDKEYIFQNGMGKIFSKDQAMFMFNALKD